MKTKELQTILIYIVPTVLLISIVGGTLGWLLAGWIGGITCSLVPTISVLLSFWIASWKEVPWPGDEK